MTQTQVGASTMSTPDQYGHGRRHFNWCPAKAREARGAEALEQTRQWIPSLQESARQKCGAEVHSGRPCIVRPWDSVRLESDRCRPCAQRALTGCRRARGRSSSGRRRAKLTALLGRRLAKLPAKLTRPGLQKVAWMHQPPAARLTGLEGAEKVSGEQRDHLAKQQ